MNTPRLAIHDLVHDAAAQSPQRVAVAAGDVKVTYRELIERARRIGTTLLNAGASPGDLVAILTPDPVDIIPAILAVLDVGCAFVPIDVRTPPLRIRRMIRAVTPRWLLLGESADPSPSMTYGDERTTVIDLGALDAAADFPRAEWDPDGLCYIYFTSGSTGEPKPIGGRFKAIAHFIEWEIRTFAVNAASRISQITSPAYDAYLRDVFTPLAAGATVCVPDTPLVSAGGAPLAEWLERAGVTHLHCTPTLFRTLLHGVPPARLAALRFILMAGEPLTPADVRRWIEMMGERVELVNLYGPSETTMTKLYHRVSAADAERQFIPIGKPMDGARAIVLDGAGAPCAVGIVGEIYLRTPYRSLGYHRRPELNEGAFVPNPFNADPTDLLYRTGDLGRILEDGNLEWIGRRDGQVKIRGVRVELAEVESALRQHEHVRDVAVVDRDDGDGRYLCAYVVVHPHVESSELRDLLAERLVDAMIPTVFVALPILPRTLTGKIDRTALPAPQESVQRQRVPYEPPATPAEKALAQIWEELLPVGSPSVLQSFFTAGGHSLLAMQVVARVQATLGISIPLREFLMNPTIRCLASLVDEALREQAPEIDDLIDMAEAIPADSSPNPA